MVKPKERAVADTAIIGTIPAKNSKGSKPPTVHRIDTETRMRMKITTRCVLLLIFLPILPMANIRRTPRIMADARYNEYISPTPNPLSL